MARRAYFIVLALLLGACSLPSPFTPTQTPMPPTRVPSTGTPATRITPTAPGTPSGARLSYKVAAFYYPWYGTPQLDGKWLHWDQNGHTPPADIGSDYFPVLGPYSSNDPAVLDQH